jgi:hypothetical protein
MDMLLWYGNIIELKIRNSQSEDVQKWHIIVEKYTDYLIRGNYSP